MKKVRVAAALLSLICIFTSLGVYASNRCSAVFRSDEPIYKDPLDKRIYFERGTDTDLHPSPKTSIDLGAIRGKLRNAYEAELEFALTKWYSPQYFLKKSKAASSKEQAAETLKKIRAILISAKNDALIGKLHTVNTRPLIVTTHPKGSIRFFQINLGVRRTGDKARDTKLAIEELDRTLLEIDRLEIYHRYQKPTSAQAAKFEALTQDLKNSGNVYLLRKGKEFSLDHLVLGKSYLVVVADGKVVLGEGYRNLNGGTSNTHNQLRDDVGVKDKNQAAGSLLFNTNGTIDISGYHSKTADPHSAKVISDIIRSSVSEDTVIRSTDRRLTDL